MPVFRIFAALLACFYLTAAAADTPTVRELYEQAVDAYNQQQYDRAIELYQQITTMAPHFAPAYTGIGLALKTKGADVDEVLYYYKTATDMDPTNAPAFEQLGRLYYSLNKLDKAEKNFFQAVKIDPGLASAKLSLGWIYLLGKSKPETAVKYFKDVIRATPAPNAYFGLGMAYFSSNQRVKAIEVITTLRKMGEEDFAKRLEQMVRENRSVNLNPGPGGAQSTEDSATGAEAAAAPATPAGETGVKVRLSGKLDDI